LKKKAELEKVAAKPPTPRAHLPPKKSKKDESSVK